MHHPLEDIIRTAEPFVFIGDSREDRFPAMSYANAERKQHRVYYLDLGGLTQSRGPVRGGKVYAHAGEIPSDRSDLAVLWVKPSSARRAVDVAHGLGARRLWFSFKTGHIEAVEHARALGLTVVEIGRCPVFYMEGQIPACALHTLAVKASGAYRLPPQTEPRSARRELY
ncbi:MAG: hypothetical protein JWN48_1491 [Myxococcaceae bacterium]|nr:hypothetical protein [Myxococcaceae bacterium]